MSTRTRGTRAAAAAATAAAAPAPSKAAAAKKAATTASKSRTTAAAAAPRKKAAQMTDTEEDEEEEEEVSSESESESEEEEEKPAPKARAKKAAASTTTARGKKATTASAAAAVAPAPSPSSSALTPAQSLHLKLRSLLSEAQHSYHTHASLASKALTLLTASPEDFLTSFLSHTLFVCTQGRKLATVQRVVEWVGVFVATAFSSPHVAVQGFGESVLKSLVSWSRSKDKVVRHRSCQLFGEIIKNLGEEAEIADELFDAATEALMERARDKIDAVRVAATLALHRFQSGEEGDPVGEMYVKLMSFDASKDVRKAAIEHVAAARSPSAIQALLARTTDQEPLVRVAAFKSLHNKVHMKQLSIRERTRLIKVGFNDRDPAVQRAAQTLVAEAWMATKEKDVIRLLKSLAVEEFREECTLLLTHLFKNVGVQKWSTTQQPPYSAAELTPERALYWRVYVESLKQLDGEENAALLDAALPDTIELCSLLVSHQHHEFICHQLLSLVQCGVDLADEAGRRELCRIVENLLKDISVDQALVPPLMQVYRMVHGGGEGGDDGLNPRDRDGENGFIGVVLLLLSDIRDPLDRQEDDQSARKRQQLEEAYQHMHTAMDKLNIQKQACLNEENYEGANQVKQQLGALMSELYEVERELNSVGFQDDATLARLLSIVCDLLEHTQRFKLNHPGLKGLLESTIEPGIRSEHELVQTLGLKAAALYALLDRMTAAQFLPMFLSAASTAPNLLQQATALRAITDLLMMFEGLLEEGEKVVAEEAEGGAEAAAAAASEPSLLDQVQALFSKHLMHAFESDGDAPSDLNEVCVMGLEGLAKLLLYDRLPVSSAMLAALLSIFCNPSTDTRIVQWLAVFLPAFVVVNPEQHVAAFMHAVLPSMRLLHTATEQAAAAAQATAAGVAPSAAVRKAELDRSTKAMLSFFAHVPASHRVNGYPVQQAFALEICHQLLAFPQDATTHHLVTALSFLNLADSSDSTTSSASPSPPFLPTFRHLLSTLSRTLTDKPTLKELSRFTDKLDKLHPPPIVEATEEEDDDDEAGEVIGAGLTEEQLEEVEREMKQRVQVLREERAAEEQLEEELEPADGSSAKQSKKKATAATKKSTQGKRALRPKTPAKSRRAAEVDSSSSESEQSQSEEEEEEEEEEEVKAPTRSSRPSRASKMQAQAKMVKAVAGQKKVDQLLKEAEEEEEKEAEEEEEEEDEEEESDEE